MRHSLGINIRTMNRLIPLATLLLLPGATFAETFRCGNWIASSDMTVDELVQKCGEPTTRSVEVKDVLVRNRDVGLMTKTGETTIETWTYDRGAHNAPMVVTIVDGHIKSLERKK